jgi:hypothetical protein
MASSAANLSDLGRADNVAPAALAQPRQIVDARHAAVGIPDLGQANEVDLQPSHKLT